MKHLSIKNIVAILGCIAIILTLTVEKKPAAIQVASTASAAEVHQSCENKTIPSETFQGYEDIFWEYMKANGGRKTLVLLDELKNLGGYANTNCHPLSHKVGNIALHVYGSVPAAVPEYIPVCHSGYYHGLLEEYLATAESFEQGVKEVCGKAEEQEFFNWFQCMHGLGHGIMQFQDNEVPLSLQSCDLLSPDSQAQEMCYAGVFMENITTDEKTGHPSKYIRKSDPIYPCNAVEEKYKRACYFLSSSQILKLNAWNFPETFKICDKVEEEYDWLCYQSLGRDVSGFSLRNPEQVQKLCELGSSHKAKTGCYFGAVRDFINELGEFDSGINLCNDLSIAYQKACFDGVFFDLIKLRPGESRLKECEKMIEPYKTECKSTKV